MTKAEIKKWMNIGMVVLGAIGAGAAVFFAGRQGLKHFKALEAARMAAEAYRQSNPSQQAEGDFAQPKVGWGENCGYHGSIYSQSKPSAVKKKENDEETALLLCVQSIASMFSKLFKVCQAGVMIARELSNVFKPDLIGQDQYYGENVWDNRVFNNTHTYNNGWGAPKQDPNNPAPCWFRRINPMIVEAVPYNKPNQPSYFNSGWDC